MGAVNHQINRDTQLCVSLAARPSNIGTRFHNFLYEALDLNFVYKAFSPVDLTAAVQGIRGLPIRGAAVSMPFKTAVIPLVDELDETASAVEAVNTIVNTDGHLKCYNTDFGAVRDLLHESGWDAGSRVVVLGSGGMARAVVAAVAGLGAAEITVASRNADAGGALSAKYAARYAQSAAGDYDVLVNCTPMGMAGGAEAEELPFSRAAVEQASLVVDVVAMPVVTPLLRLAEELRKPVVTGADIMTRQAVEQFFLYTGVRPAADLVAKAQEWSRQG